LEEGLKDLLAVLCVDADARVTHLDAPSRPLGVAAAPRGH
jgi:hypothetical protein